MQLSRAINPDFSGKNRLGFICKKYKIEYDEDVAHRANFDAEVLYKV
jgi:DNA polymerase-3 subunit alpha (Gram-positive type)